MELDAQKVTDVGSQQDLATYDARRLIEDGVQARLLLDDQTCYLRITRTGKLILTK